MGWFGDEARLFSEVHCERMRSDDCSTLYFGQTEIFFHHLGGQTLEQVDQTDCGIFNLGDTQNYNGQDPEQSALTRPVLTWAWIR